MSVSSLKNKISNHKSKCFYGSNNDEQEDNRDGEYESSFKKPKSYFDEIKKIDFDAVYQRKKRKPRNKNVETVQVIDMAKAQKDHINKFNISLKILGFTQKDIRRLHVFRSNIPNNANVQDVNNLKDILNCRTVQIFAGFVIDEYKKLQNDKSIKYFNMKKAMVNMELSLIKKAEETQKIKNDYIASKKQMVQNMLE